MGTRDPRRAAPARRALLAALVATGLTASTAVAGVATAAPAAAQDPVLAPGQWRCSADVATSAAVPVLLVHGTAMSAEENWATTYEPMLRDRGHAVCLVALPRWATGDVLASTDAVAGAIARVHVAAGRPIAVLGHSQGAYLPRAALRLHPQLAPLVTDVIGLAGVYDAGSQQLATRCATESCVPALHQLAAGSDLLGAVARRPLPSGPDYTNIGSSGDGNITPQPLANRQDGATSVLLQDLCPGRELQGLDHALIVGDTVAAALVTDALDHPGPSDPARVRPEACDTAWYPGFDPGQFTGFSREVGPRTRSGVLVTEPVVPCRIRASCSDAAARGRLLDRVTTRRAGTRWVLRATADGSGQVRLRLGRHQEVVSVTPGRAVTMSVPISWRRRSATMTATVLTRPRYFTAWAPEDRATVRRR